MPMLTGASILKRGILRNLISATEQLQPCGVDLTLRRVRRWTSTPILDFDGSTWRAANTRELQFADNTAPQDTAYDSAGDRVACLRLGPGAYLVDFNESCRMPPGYAGQIFARSSVWRSGAGLAAGVVNAGYDGSLGAVLEVKHKFGVLLRRDAKMAQFVVHRMEEEEGEEGEGGVAQGDRGIDQNAVDVSGRDGPAY